MGWFQHAFIQLFLMAFIFSLTDRHFIKHMLLFDISSIIRCESLVKSAPGVSNNNLVHDPRVTTSTSESG